MQIPDMKNFKLPISIFSVAIMIIIASCQSTKSSTASKMLSFNFEKGKGYDYEMITNIDQEEGNEKHQFDMSNYYSMDVTGEEGDAKTIDIRYERLKMKIPFQGLSLEIDSDKPLPNLGIGGTADPIKMINGVMGAVIGHNFQMKVNREGQIMEISGFEQMFNAIADSLKLDGEKREEVMQVFRKQLGDSSVRAHFERLLYIFPNKEVKVGDSWSKTLSPKGPLGGNYKSTYTVSEIEGDMVTLEEKSTVSGHSEGMGLNGTSKGTMVIDSRSGLVVSGDQDIEMNGGKEGKDFKLRAKTRIRGKAR